MSRFVQDSPPLSPLERFVREYVEARDGAWDEIEPQVYDLLVGPEMMQVAFDPEALPEHPQAQLASLGSPLLDRLLGDAANRWNSAQLYRVGLNLRRYDLESRLRRAILLPPGAAIEVERVRAMNFPQAIFWFQATFASDQKEEEILPVGIGLHYLREVRHLDALLLSSRLSTEPEANLPEVRHGGVVAGYLASRGALVRTAAALANARRREWSGRVDKQVARMVAYYAQLRTEAQEQIVRGGDPNAAAGRAAARREAIDREQQLRVAELRQKSAVRVSAKLVGLMVVQQPKLLISAVILQKDQPSGRLELVWDSLTESVEAVPCPSCGHPTLALRIDRTRLCCAGCSLGVQNGRER